MKPVLGTCVRNVEDDMTKPVFKDGLFACPSCGNLDTVALDLDNGMYETLDTLIWCTCGKVSVIMGAKTSIIYDFKEKSK